MVGFIANDRNMGHRRGCLNTRWDCCMDFTWLGLKSQIIAKRIRSYLLASKHQGINENLSIETWRQ